MIQQATAADIPALCNLLNSAYRGDASRQGWTTEADLISGTVRTSALALAQLLERHGSVFLVEKENEIITGCVNLQQEGQRLLLGMLSVSPALQGKGTGKLLLQAAEVHAKTLGLAAIYMKVISVRSELLDWYIRHGYQDTGERQPFDAGNPDFGTPTQPLEFIVLEKKM